MREVDIWSKGDVLLFLKELVDKGQIQNCVNLYVEKWGLHQIFRCICLKDLCKWESALNVTTDTCNYRAPSGYSWPVCLENCHKLKSVPDLIKHLDPDEDEQAVVTPNNQEIEGADIVINGTPIEKLLDNKDQQAKELPYPNKVTLRWLYRNVTWQIWVLFCSIVVTAFVIGFKCGKIDFFVKVANLFPN